MKTNANKTAESNSATCALCAEPAVARGFCHAHLDCYELEDDPPLSRDADRKCKMCGGDAIRDHYIQHAPDGDYYGIVRCRRPANDKDQERKPPASACSENKE